MKIYRFSLCIQEGKKFPFIMVDVNFISEIIVKRRNKWQFCYQLTIDDEFCEIAKFNDWKNIKHDCELRGENGERIKITSKDWDEMRKAVMKRDKRIKLLD